jgi:hypothetical protein
MIAILHKAAWQRHVLSLWAPAVIGSLVAVDGLGALHRVLHWGIGAGDTA